VEAQFNGPAPAALRDLESGARIPVEADGGKLRFIAQNVPAMGYRTYAFAEAAAPAKSGLSADEKSQVIENQFFRVTLDPAQGRIASVFDKSAKRELVDAKAEFGFGQYVHEQFSAADMQRFVDTYTKGKGGAQMGDFGKPKMPPVEQLPHRASSPRNLKLRIQRGPVSVTAVMEAEKQDGSPYATDLAVTLYDGQPYVNVGWRVKDKSATPAPEGGWLSFPLAVARPQFRLARLGAVIDPAKDTITGTNHDVYSLTGGVAVLDSKQTGVGLCPIDSPLVSLDHPGLWEYTKQFTSTKPRVFVNLYNNLWGTNFAQWSEGSWPSRVRVWSVQKYEPFAGIIRPSMEARTPLRGAVEDGPAGKLPASKAGLRINRPGVIVTAFGKNPDGPGRLLRLWEQAGKDGPVQVCLPDGMDKVQPADLRGRPQGKPLAVSKGCFTTELRHYGPASFIY
jgi:hypothetical protein